MPATSDVPPPPLPPPPHPICHRVAPASPPAEVFRKSRRVNMIVLSLLQRERAPGTNAVGESENGLDVAAGGRRDRVHGRTRIAAGAHRHRLGRHLLRPRALAKRIAWTPGCRAGADRHSAAQVGKRKRLDSVAAVGRPQNRVEYYIWTDVEERAIAQPPPARNESC